MENWKYKTQAGVEVELTETDMMLIHQHFESMNTLEYLTEKYPNVNENTLKQMAYEVKHKMLKFGYTEEEAIGEILNEYEPATLFIEVDKEVVLHEDMFLIGMKEVVLEGKKFDRVHVRYIDHNRAGLNKWCVDNSFSYSLGEFTEKMTTSIEEA